MSLVILKYLGEGNFMMTGQHETLLVLRRDGSIQNIESLNVGAAGAILMYHLAHEGEAL